MDFNVYAAEQLVRVRLADLRAAGARASLIESARVGPRGLRPALGEPSSGSDAGWPRGRASRRRMQGCESPAEIVCLPPGRGGPGPWRR